MIAIIGIAVTAGRYESSIEATVETVKDQQRQIGAVVTEIHVEQQEITDIDHRVIRLEDRKHAN